MVRLSLDRLVPIHALRDALVLRYDRISPEEILRLLRDVGNAFPNNSISRNLAELFRVRIIHHWQNGTLSRYLLILLAFPMLYESAVNLIDVRRRLSIILTYHGIMNFVFTPPSPALRIL